MRRRERCADHPHQPQTLDSIVRLIRSRVEVTLRWLARRRRRPS
ncbi:MAG TPA: hypothetical protein VLM79_28755 [Kofleriaceae bacterium]|nr:hypothetical protein [Kofleriaceae bacterium]